MSFKDQFKKKNTNESNQNNEKETPLHRSNQHDVEFAEEAAREAGLTLEEYKKNKPQ